MATKKPTPPKRRCAPPAGKQGATDENASRSDDPPADASHDETPGMPIPASVAWPLAGHTLRIGRQTVTGMAVHEGPPFYLLT